VADWRDDPAFVAQAPLAEKKVDNMHISLCRKYVETIKQFAPVGTAQRKDALLLCGEWKRAIEAGEMDWPKQNRERFEAACLAAGFGLDFSPVLSGQKLVDATMEVFEVPKRQTKEPEVRNLKKEKEVVEQMKLGDEK